MLCPSNMSEGEVATAPCYDTHHLGDNPDAACGSVDAAIVLTMPSARRRQEALGAQLPVLRDLGRRLYVQCNRGYRECAKAHVQTAAADLLHATMQAFRMARDMGFDNVATVEDDVRFDVRDPIKHLRRVDAFLRSREGNFGTYNLGCFADLLLPTGQPHHRRIVGFRGCAQCVVWSRQAREEVLATVDLSRLPRNLVPHLDNPKLIRPVGRRAYTYYKPLATQVFPTTENSRNWCFGSACMRGDAGAPKRLRHRLHARVVSELIRATGVDRRTSPAWALGYGGGFGMIGCPVVAALALCVCVALCVVITRGFRPQGRHGG